VNQISQRTVEGSSPAASLGVQGANERIGVAVVGLSWACAGLGPNHLMGIHQEPKENNTKLVAAFDVFSKYRSWAAQTTNLKES